MAKAATVKNYQYWLISFKYSYTPLTNSRRNLRFSVLLQDTSVPAEAGIQPMTIQMRDERQPPKSKSNS